MSVVIETTLGDITVDLYTRERPITCLNFLKLCKMKFYNFNLFHTIRSGFIAQTGDPTGEGSGGQSIWGLIEGPEKRYFSGEKIPKIRHTDVGLLSMVCTGDAMIGSQFFFTLGSNLDSLDAIHCVIGEVAEGHEILRKLNEVICDETHRPYQDVRITHTVVLDDPFSDPSGLREPSRSPSPSEERLQGGRIAPDEELDETKGKSYAEMQELIEEKEAKARATILEIVGDLPDADIAPPENVLFVCKLNPVTTDEDLEIIFSRFGKIVNCEVIRDKKTGDSLQYAFIEFDDKKPCEDAYFKMDNVLIDDRRIHVDFSQSVSKIKYLGKGRGVKHLTDEEAYSGKRTVMKNRRSPSIERNKKRDNDKERRRESDSQRDRESDRNRRYNSDIRRHEDSYRDKDKNSNKERENHRDSKVDRDRYKKREENDIKSRDVMKDKKDDREGHSYRKYDSEKRRIRNRSKSPLRDRKSKPEKEYSKSKESSKNTKENVKDRDHRNEKSHRTMKEKDQNPRKENDKYKNHSKNTDKESKITVNNDDIKESNKESNSLKTKTKHSKDKQSNGDKSASKSKVASEVKRKAKTSNTEKKKSKRQVAKKRKHSMSSSSSSSTSSSSSSSESSESSESDHKKGKSRSKKRKRSTSESSSDSSTSSSSSSSSDSSSESSTDSEPRKKKSKKVVKKKTS